MKILVVTSDVPFVHGGHRVIANCIVRALRDRGIEAETLTTPQNRFGRQFAAYAATWLTDVGLTGAGEKVDQIITLRFPCYALRHERHVCWLLHRMREYYDLWPDWRARLSWKGAIKERIRRTLIHAADNHLLRRVDKLFALSKTVQARLTQWGGHASEVLYPPPPQREYHCDSFENFVFAPSRLASLKRQHLLVEALAQTQGLRAVIAGEGETRPQIETLIRERGLDRRVEFVGHLSEKELLDYYARCRTVFFGPREEDFGFVTVEAFASRKPVITCTDSGGAAELVADGNSGFIVAPDANAVARALNTLAQDPALAERLGSVGHARVTSMSWAETVDRLILQA